MKKPATKKTTARNLKATELVTIQGGSPDRTGPTFSFPVRFF